MRKFIFFLVPHEESKTEKNAMRMYDWFFTKIDWFFIKITSYAIFFYYFIFQFQFRQMLLRILAIDFFTSLIVDRLCLILFGEGKLRKLWKWNDAFEFGAKNSFIIKNYLHAYVDESIFFKLLVHTLFMKYKQFSKPRNLDLVWQNQIFFPWNFKSNDIFFHEINIIMCAWKR